MKILSVVIPMYNVELYIGQCLESFNIEEIADDIEILVIDDGSPDGSAGIAEVYQKARPDVYRIIRKENGGHGSAVNRGIEEAAGKYFKVVDGDDWVDRGAFIHLVETLKQNDADMVFSNYLWFDQRSGRERAEAELLCPGIEYGRIYPADEVLNRTFLKMHAVTYKTGILKNMPEQLDENCFYVDAEYIVFPLPYIKTVLFIEDFVYQYRVGMPTQSMNIARMQERCGQHERVLRRLLEFYGQNRLRSCAPAIAGVIARMAVSQYKIYLSFPKCRKRCLKDLDRNIKEQYPEIYRAVTSRPVRLLRGSGYLLCFAASGLLRWKLRDQN